MSKVFCGVGNIPKGKKRGSMKECADAGQVRYYGIKKIDEKLVEQALASKKRSSKKGSAVDPKMKVFELIGKVKHAERLVRTEKDAKKKKKLEATVKDLKAELAAVRSKSKTQKRQSSRKKKGSTKK